MRILVIADPLDEFKTYKGLSHSSSPAELQDIKTFMQTLLPAEK